MASLKDMRNRIASVKATRKITKAMQMVAAAKLRRAQEAATAARPYAERMARVLGNVNANIADKAGASPLLVGTGKDQVHLLVVMTAERGLCGGFNSNIARLARQDAVGSPAAGKTVKILMVGRKGADALRRDWGRTVVDRVDLKAVKQLAYVNAEAIADKVLAMFEAGEFDVCTLYFSEFKSVIAQKPTALQLIPAQLPGQAHGSAGCQVAGRLRVRAERGGNPRPADRAQHHDADLPRPARERRQRAGRAHVGHGQRHAQRRRHDQQADDQVQSPAPGQHHQGADRDHLRRRGALRILRQAGLARQP